MLCSKLKASAGPGVLGAIFCPLNEKPQCSVSMFHLLHADCFICFAPADSLVPLLCWLPCGVTPAGMKSAWSKSTRCKGQLSPCQPIPFHCSKPDRGPRKPTVKSLYLRAGGCSSAGYGLLPTQEPRFDPQHVKEKQKSSGHVFFFLLYALMFFCLHVCVRVSNSGNQPGSYGSTASALNRRAMSPSLWGSLIGRPASFSKIQSA